MIGQHRDVRAHYARWFAHSMSRAGRVGTSNAIQTRVYRAVVPRRAVLADVVDSADIDAERSRLYLDLILIALSKSAPEVLKAAMNSLGYEYQSDFARRYVAQGRAEIVIKLLALRFAPLTEAVQARVRNSREAQLDAVAERILTAHTLEEALDPLS